MNRNGFVSWVLIFVVLVTLAGVGIFYFQFNQNKKLSSEVPVSANPNPSVLNPQDSSQVKLTIQDDYYLSLDLPSGYGLKDFDFDLPARILDNQGKEVILIRRLTLGGERNNISERVLIDNVPFDVFLIPEGDWGCNGELEVFQSKYKYPQIDYDDPNYDISDWFDFSIGTSCGEGDKQTQAAVNRRIINSIKFSSKLKDVLLGNIEIFKLKK